MSNKTVSIIIPCFNHGRYLPDAIRSGLEQSHPGVEVIVVNDGSSDDTEAVALSFRQADPRVVYVAQPNLGLAASRNAGLAAATGDYIQFLDADDLLHKDKLRLQLEALAALDGPAVAWCDYIACRIDDLSSESVGRYLPPTGIHPRLLDDFILRWETQFSIPVHCFLFDVYFFRELELRFDEALPNHEDLDCWLNIFYHEPGVVFLEEKLVYYRIRKDAMCTDVRLMKAGYNLVLRKHFTKNLLHPLRAGLFAYKYLKMNHYL